MLKDTRIPIDGSTIIHADLQGLNSDDHKQYALTSGSERAEIAVNSPGTHQILVLDSTSGYLFNSDEFGISRITYINDIQFDPKIEAEFPTFQEGKMFYDETNHALAYYNEVSDVTIQVGQETVVRARNRTGSTIYNGQAVLITGATGQTPTIDLGLSSVAERSYITGLATHDIPNNVTGYVTVRGIVHDLDTSSLIEGEPVYLSPDIPGGLTAISPVSPNFITAIGVCTYVHGSLGTVYVSPVSFTYLSTLQDVQVTNPQEGELFVYDSTAGYWVNQDALKDYTLRSEWDQNGFVDRSASTLTWTDSTPDRTLSIQPTGTSFDYYVEGVRYTSTGDTIQISNTEGMHIIYYDRAVLTVLASPTETQVDTIIKTKALVSYVYWDVSAATAIYVGEERHGYSMSPTTHEYLHDTVGYRYLSGLSLTDILSNQNGSLNSHAQFGVSSGSCTDEDLYHSISAITSTTGLPIYYITGSNDWNRYINAGFSVRTFDGTPATTLAWNEYVGGVWQLSAVASNNFVLYHVFATAEKDYPMISIMGQNQYTNITNAQNGAQVEIKELIINDILFPEFKPIATVIFKTNTSYTNDVNAFIAQTADGGDYVDWRYEDISRIAVGVSGTSGTSGTSSNVIVGSESLLNGDNTATITFSAAEADTNYRISTQLVNIVDVSPLFYSTIITEKTVNGFSVIFSGNMDSSNYTLEWAIMRTSP